jgi:hypothetical protein
MRLTHDDKAQQLLHQRTTGLFGQRPEHIRLIGNGVDTQLS